MKAAWRNYKAPLKNRPTRTPHLVFSHPQTPHSPPSVAGQQRTQYVIFFSVLFRIPHREPRFSKSLERLSFFFTTIVMPLSGTNQWYKGTVVNALSSIEHLYRRHGIFYFRMQVPERFRAAVNKREIKLSLRTTDILLAKRKCRLLSCAIETILDNSDVDMSSGEVIILLSKNIPCLRRLNRGARKI